jgi:hypothetical protein
MEWVRHHDRYDENHRVDPTALPKGSSCHCETAGADA